jgi:hypothetical protein
MGSVCNFFLELVMVPEGLFASFSVKNARRTTPQALLQSNNKEAT